MRSPFRSPGLEYVPLSHPAWSALPFSHQMPSSLPVRPEAPCRRALQGQLDDARQAVGVSRRPAEGQAGCGSGRDAQDSGQRRAYRTATRGASSKLPTRTHSSASPCPWNLRYTGRVDGGMAPDTPPGARSLPSPRLAKSRAARHGSSRRWPHRPWMDPQLGSAWRSGSREVACVGGPAR